MIHNKFFFRGKPQNLRNKPISRGKSIHIKKAILPIIFLLTGSLWLILALSSYGPVKHLADSFAADGSLELFTPALFQTLKRLSIILAAVHFALFFWIILRPESAVHCLRHHLRSIASLPARLIRDIPRFGRSFIHACRMDRTEGLFLLVILAAGLTVRLLLINRPMAHDESYSVYIWGSSSLRHTTNDYHLPNNHIFHSILVNLIYHHLGKTPALVRLPALISGWLMIPSAFLLGKKLYNRETGFLTAGLTAFSPFLIDYSANARGYTIFALLTVWILLLGLYLQKHKNLAGWLLLILLSAIGFYTLPVMLYPFGALCVWLFLHILFRRTSPAYSGPWNFLKYLIVCGLSVSVLTLLLYMPVFLNSGTAALFSNVFVQPLPEQDFLPTMLSRLTDNFHAFTGTVPKFIVAWLIFGNLLMLVRHQRKSFIRVFLQLALALWLVLEFGRLTTRMPFAVWTAFFCANLILLLIFESRRSDTIPLQLALLIWLPPVILYQRPNLWPRTQTYLLVLLILWGAAGTVLILETIFHHLSEKYQKTLMLCMVGIFILAAAVPQFKTALTDYGKTGSHETAVLTMMQAGLDDALIVVAPEDDAPVWYYPDRYDLPKSLFDKNRPFAAVYVYANPQNEGFEEPRTPRDVINRYGPGEAFVLADSAQMLMDLSDAVLIRYDANQRVIEKTFHTN